MLFVSNQFNIIKTRIIVAHRNKIQPPMTGELKNCNLCDFSRQQGTSEKSWIGHIH